MIKWIVLQLIKWCERTDRVVKIYDRDTDGNSKGTLYLVRYMLFHSKYFCLYIHRFMKSDLEVLHDHPWNFFTYIVDGQYTERTVQSDVYNKFHVWPVKFKESTNFRTKGSLAFRKATDIHRVEIARNYKEEEIENAPLTMCFIGPRVREWGFWVPTNEGKHRWVLWTEFLELDPSHPEFKGHS